jgi:hypothetical protein
VEPIYWLEQYHGPHVLTKSVVGGPYRGITEALGAS